MRGKSETSTETSSEKSAKKLLAYLDKSMRAFFKNNNTARKKLGMGIGTMNAAVKILQSLGILRKYNRGVYRIDRRLLKNQMEVKK